MPWTCEICGRIFNRKGQYHSCKQRSLDAAFSRQGEKWRYLYAELKKRVEERIGPFAEHCPSVGVMWKHTSTFGEVKFKRAFMEVVFYSDRFRPDRNPTRWLQTSVNRTAHVVAVSDDSLFDDIVDWLEESYFLTKR